MIKVVSGVMQWCNRCLAGGGGGGGWGGERKELCTSLPPVGSGLEVAHWFTIKGVCVQVALCTGLPTKGFLWRWGCTVVTIKGFFVRVGLCTDLPSKRFVWRWGCALVTIKGAFVRVVLSTDLLSKGYVWGCALVYLYRGLCEVSMRLCTDLPS